MAVEASKTYSGLEKEQKPLKKEFDRAEKLVRDIEHLVEGNIPTNRSAGEAAGDFVFGTHGKAGRTPRAELIEGLDRIDRAVEEVTSVFASEPAPEPQLPAEVAHLDDEPVALPSGPMGAFVDKFATDDETGDPDAFLARERGEVRVPEPPKTNGTFLDRYATENDLGDDPEAFLAQERYGQRRMELPDSLSYDHFKAVLTAPLPSLTKAAQQYQDGWKEFLDNKITLEQFGNIVFTYVCAEYPENNITPFKAHALHANASRQIAEYIAFKEAGMTSADLEKQKTSASGKEKQRPKKKPERKSWLRRTIGSALFLAGVGASDLSTDHHAVHPHPEIRGGTSIDSLVVTDQAQRERLAREGENRLAPGRVGPKIIKHTDGLP
jgi:hypothetical protein